MYIDKFDDTSSYHPTLTETYNGRKDIHNPIQRADMHLLSVAAIPIQTEKYWYLTHKNVTLNKM